MLDAAGSGEEPALGAEIALRMGGAGQRKHSKLVGILTGYLAVVKQGIIGECVWEEQLPTRICVRIYDHSVPQYPVWIWESSGR